MQLCYTYCSKALNAARYHLRDMLSTLDILAVMEEEESHSIRDLAKKLGIPQPQLERILRELTQKGVIEYDDKTKQARMPQWIANLDKEIEEIKPAVGTIILPKNQSIIVQDLTIGNLTDTDLELNVTLRARQKEIAICKLT